MFNLNEGLLSYLFPNGVKAFTLFGSLLLVLLASYLLGSINSAILISKTVYKDDIRKHGSGNGGMTNMLRTFGGKAAPLMTLVGDLLKTSLSVLLAAAVFGFRYFAGVSTQGFCYFAGLFAVLGHIFPLYYKFKGGKGVLVTASMALILTPLPFFLLLCLFVAVVAMSKYVSLGSVCVAVLYPVMLRGTFAVIGIPLDGLIALSSIILACIIVWCHRENLQRISERTERKISFGKKKDE